MYLLRDAPAHAGVAFVAGVAALELQQIPLATQCLERAVRINPDRADYLAQYARVLVMARQSREAHHAADRAMTLQPEDVLSMDTLGVVYSQLNAYGHARDAFAKVVEKMPGVASYRFNLATALIFHGEIDAAESELEACLTIDPDFWRAHLSLAQLRKQTCDHNHVERLRVLLSSHSQVDDARLYLNLALAKELEDLGEYSLSFRMLTAGKRAGKEGRGDSTVRDKVVFSAIEQHWRPSSGNSGCRDGAPIFVIGMPRSGTTLVDRILSSHPDVQSAGELQDFGVLLKQLSGSTTLQLLDEDTFAKASALDWSRLGHAYIESVRSLVPQSPRFVDKLPHNFLYAGYIANALPDARIVCLRRGSMDSCLGNFRQLFALSSPYYDYSFDILDTGKYYVMFDRLMRFWRERLGDRLLEVRYEDLVDRQRDTTAGILEHCQLEWNDACLDFANNQAPVGTASAVQVRRSMNRDALDRWKRYEQELEPLRLLLENEGIAVS
nr:sulfotransferase [Lysobacter silvestris]